MPIKISSVLPAYQDLKDENILILDNEDAITSRVRPLQLAIVNVMPTKTTTETQILRLLGNTMLQVEVELIRMESHDPKNVSKGHMDHFYKSFDDIKDRKFDGLIITGAPVEQMPFEDVEYWSELCKLFEWSKTHVKTTLHICWGAQAGLYYHYKIPKYPLDAKVFGVFEHTVEKENTDLFRGFDDVFLAPHSRHTYVKREDIENCKEIDILSSSDGAGVFAAANKDYSQIYIFGHIEYDRRTLEAEYLRDKNAGLPIAVPKNYYPNDDDTKKPMMNWRAHANLFYYNWLNYYVSR